MSMGAFIPGADHGIRSPRSDFNSYPHPLVTYSGCVFLYFLYVSDRQEGKRGSQSESEAEKWKAFPSLSSLTSLSTHTHFSSLI